ncbi:hypothetical protein B0H17DRAFT_454514 [Mycena rosella]|uniref:Uncharacterized protein n=1 Tax=Mycena rosella TaxID=1033263 RepID=A0AAD7MAY7_MYCRO|nr:hypothetical protein B0H17DRAFT_454514 [Mycena rosella]
MCLASHFGREPCFTSSWWASCTSKALRTEIFTPAMSFGTAVTFAPALDRVPHLKDSSSAELVVWLSLTLAYLAPELDSGCPFDSFPADVLSLASLFSFLNPPAEVPAAYQALIADMTSLILGARPTAHAAFGRLKELNDQLPA